MRARDSEVVDLDGVEREHALYELGALLPAPCIGALDADQQLGRRNRGDRDVVLVVDQLVERETIALGCDEDRRVEDQPRQRRSSMRRAERRAWSSSPHAASRGFARKASLTAAPWAAGAGPTRATGRPLRTTTNDSPRLSTASSISENRRAASVAL